MDVNKKELEELVKFLHIPVHSQILLPFCSSTSCDDFKSTDYEQRPPIALLSGNINLRRSLRKDGVALPYEAELERLERNLDEIQERQVLAKIGTGEVINLSNELEKIKIDMPRAGDAFKEKEVEIKEELSEDLLKKYSVEKRTERHFNTKTTIHMQTNAAIPEDIDELLRLAELEDEQVKPEVSKKETKLQSIKSELIAPKEKKINLPKVHSVGNGLIGDIIERDSKPNAKPPMTMLEDPVSSRIILNELRGSDLKVSTLPSSSLEEENGNSVCTPNKPLKRSSLFKANLKNK